MVLVWWRIRLRESKLSVNVNLFAFKGLIVSARFNINSYGETLSAYCGSKLVTFSHGLSRDALLLTDVRFFSIAPFLYTINSSERGSVKSLSPEENSFPCEKPSPYVFLQGYFSLKALIFFPTNSSAQAIASSKTSKGEVSNSNSFI